MSGPGLESAINFPTPTPSENAHASGTQAAAMGAPLLLQLLKHKQDLARMRQVKPDGCAFGHMNTASDDPTAESACVL